MTFPIKGTRALLRTTPNGMRMVQGLRSILTFSVVTGHTYLLSSIMLDNTEVYHVLDRSSPFVRQLFMSIMALSSVAIDIFLFFSGFFFVAGLMGRSSSMRPVITPGLTVRLGFSRWLRLFPLYGMIALLWRAMGVKGCIRISELLFIRNLFVRYNESVSQQFCIGHGWSLNIDVQAHCAILGIIAFSPSWRAVMRRLLSVAMCLTAIRSIAWVFSGRPVSQASSLVDVTADDEFVSHVATKLGIKRGLASPNDISSATRYASYIAYQPFYFATLFRCAPSFVGGAVSIALKERAMVAYSAYQSPLVSSCVFALTWYFFVQGFQVPFDGRNSGELFKTVNSIWFLIYEGGGRVLICLGLGLLMLSWSNAKDSERFQNSRILRLLRNISGGLLGNSFMVSLSRLSYAMFLYHVNMTWCMTRIWPTLSKDNYSPSMVLLNSIKIYVLSLALCMPFGVMEACVAFIRRKTTARCDEILKLEKHN